MYNLYVFNPAEVLIEGYVYKGTFATEQECNQEAFALGANHFRVEMVTGFGSMLVFESNYGEG
jgi:hypothetical protein